MDDRNRVDEYYCCPFSYRLGDAHSVRGRRILVKVIGLDRVNKEYGCPQTLTRINKRYLNWYPDDGLRHDS